MGGEFSTHAFADLLSNIVDNRGKTCPIDVDGLPLIATNCVKNGTLYPTFEKVRYVNQVTYDSWFRGHPEPGDLVFVCKGAPGNVCWTPDPVNFCIAQDMVAIRANQEIVDPKYLFALLRSPLTQARILNMHVGTMIPHFKKGDFKNLYFDILDDLGSQRAIGDIYFRFSEKIELSRQMNTTLEAMAQALFKSWFVDFDPVIDNALAAANPIPEPLQLRAEIRAALGDKRKPLPESIQQQFPSNFVFSEEMGWLPEGWVVSTVGDEFDVTMGQSPPGDTYNEQGEGIPFFQGRADFGFRYPSNRVHCTSPTRLASKGDTLVSVRAPVGDVNMAAEDCCIGRGVSASRHKSGSRSFSYYAMLQLREYFKVFEGEGTVFGSINQKDFKALPQLRVPVVLVHEFESYAGSFDGKIELCTESLNNLTKLRDSLLPKLLSGQLRIPDAEKLLAEAI